MARRGPRAAARLRRVGDSARARAEGGLPFGVRLGVLVVGALVVSGVVQLLLGHRAASERVLQDHQETNVSDARTLRAAYLGADVDEQPIDEMREVVQVIATRPGVRTVRIVDARQVVLVSSVHPAEVGTTRRTPAIERALAGEPSATHGEDPANIATVASRFRVPTGLLVLEVGEEFLDMEREIAELRRQVTLSGAVGLAVAIAAFLLFGGGRLHREHSRARQEALHDELTGLANHRAFQEQLRAALRQAARSRTPLTVALLDLDGFKEANDTFGHRHGDDVLAAVGRILSDTRPGDRGFRLGGDEFAFLAPGLDAAHGAVVLERIRERVQRTIPGITVSAGWHTVSGTADPLTLLDRIDAALYEAKRSGRNRALAVADTAAKPTPLVRSGQSAALRRLVAGEGLSIAYQPVRSLGRGEVLGHEALLRPLDPTWGGSPLAAIAAADRFGLLAELDRAARHAALDGAATLPADTLLFLNVHPRALESDPALSDDLLAAVKRAGRRPERVVVEVTEQSAVPLETLRTAVTALRTAGFRVAADDVGEGYAGLELLRQVPFDVIKVSREVVRAAMADAASRAVLVALLTFAAETGCTVVAEGIETADMLDALRALRPTGPRPAVHAVQGALLGWPAPAPAASAGGAATSPESARVPA